MDVRRGKTDVRWVGFHPLMDQDLSRGQLYDIHNEIKISTPLVGPTHVL
jgi:hypothetical protein